MAMIGRHAIMGERVQVEANRFQAPEKSFAAAALATGNFDSVCVHPRPV
jgi:hypothetical protein